MRESRRNELIDSYYHTVDDEDYSIFERIFSEDAAHIRPGQGSIDGRANIRKFFEEERESTNTMHSVEARFHTEEASFCKVTVSGEISGSEFEGDLISEFEFGPDSETISKYRVYRGYQR